MEIPLQVCAVTQGGEATSRCQIGELYEEPQLGNPFTPQTLNSIRAAPKLSPVGTCISVLSLEGVRLLTGSDCFSYKPKRLGVRLLRWFWAHRCAG